MYSAQREFKELVKVIDDTRLKSFAKSLLMAQPINFKIGPPLTECVDENENGNIVDTIRAIEEADTIPFTIIQMIVSEEIVKRFIKE